MSASVFLSCERHHSYESKQQALAALTARRKARGLKKTQGLRPFKCPSGKHWHLGRDKRFRNN